MLNWNKINVQCHSHLLFCHSRVSGNPSLWPSRLVYDAEVLKVPHDVAPTIRPTAAEEADYDKRKAELIPYKEAVNQTGTNVSQAIVNYNEYIRENHFDVGLWPFTDWKTFLFFELDEMPSALVLNESRTGLQKLKDGIKKLKGDPSASSAVPSEIDNLITQAEYTEDFQEYRDDLKALLTKIEEKITAYEDAIRAAAEAQTLFERDVLQRHGQNLVEGHALMMRHRETLTGFEAEPVYQRLTGKFDLALRDPELSALGDRQMRQLFLSILGQNTKGFKDTVHEGFLLGQNFSSDWEENRRNFPFLYNEWLKHNKVDSQEVAVAETVVRAQEDVLKAEGLTSVENLIIKETNDAPEKNLINSAPLKALGPEPGKPGAPALDEDLLSYHRERKDVIADLRYQYLKRAQETEKGSGDLKINKLKAGDYRQRAEKLKLFIDLEEAKITLYEWKAKEDAKKRFTREHLSAEHEERWLLEVAMRQFARAINIVDHPMGDKGVSQGDRYHPAVRRMMITMIMNEGTARWTKDDKVDDDIAEEYTSMLTELINSNDYNSNARGKLFLPDTARNYLLLARYSNLINVRIPALRDEVKKLEGQLNKPDIFSRLNLNLDDPNLTFDTARPALETKLLAGVDTDFTTRFQAARARIDTTAEAALISAGIDPNNADPETQKTVTENVLILIAQTNVPAASTVATTDRAQLIKMGTEWATANSTIPAAAPALAAITMLEYIDEFKAITADKTVLDGDPAKKLNRAKALAVKKGANPELALAGQVLTYLSKKEALRLYQEDAKDIDKFIQNPDHRATRGTTQLDRKEFWEFLRTRPGVEGPTGNEELFDDWTKDAQEVEIDYNMFDTQENKRTDVLDHMGISLKGRFETYQNYLKTHPEMRLDQWEKYLRSGDPKEFGKLMELLRTILNPPSERGGELDFLITFENWHKTQGREVTPENREQNATALYIYHALMAHFEEKEAIAAASARGEQEVVAKMEGMNIGEKFTKYGKGVLNLLIGPGQPLANRAAGMVLLYGAWKAARSAMKGDTTAGKGLRMLFLLGAAEIGMKEITGRGLIDRAHLFDTMSEAIEGTYEAVLVQREIKGINEEQHTAALYELNTVPFHVAMNWYENTNSNGDPNPGQEGNIKESWSKMKVDVDRVCPAKVKWKEKDREREAKIILKKTMEQFFGYVAEKDKSSGPNFAKEALKERWIQDTVDPNFTKAQAKYTRDLPTELTDTFHGNQNALTWQMVMRAEIDPEDVKKTVGQNWQDRVKAFAEGKLAELERWGRQDVLGWLGPAASNFWYELGVKADQVKTWLGELGEAGATKLHFGKQYAEFWYEGNKHTIRRFMDDHIELVVDGIKLPFAIIYGADQMIVPWATTKVRQIQEIIRDDKLTSTKGGGELQAQDIMTVPTGTVGRELRDIAKNPEYRYFGEYQKSFKKAFDKPDKFEMSEDPADIYQYRIGYHISAVTKEDKDVGYVKGTPPAEIMHKMQAASWKRAREDFIKRGAPQEQVDKLMYPIHVIVQKGVPGAEEVPERMYVFWRMPMPGSTEYTLKTAPGNRWTDYMDPNKHKDRPPVHFDPRLGLMENLEQALGLKLEGTRQVAGAAGLALSQALKLPAWTIEQTGIFLGGAINLIPGTTSTKVADWVKELSSMGEDRKEWLDEKLTSAQSGDYALSKFYKDPINAWWYKAALFYARDTQQNVWLGNSDLKWKGTRQNTILEEQPSNFNQADFKAWLKGPFIKQYPNKKITLPP